MILKWSLTISRDFTGESIRHLNSVDHHTKKRFSRIILFCFKNLIDEILLITLKCSHVHASLILNFIIVSCDFSRTSSDFQLVKINLENTLLWHFLSSRQLIALKNTNRIKLNKIKWTINCRKNHLL